MIHIKGNLVQNRINEIWNTKRDLPDFMHVTGYEHEDYIVESDGTVRDMDEMEFITINHELSLTQIIHEIADAVIQASL